MILKRSVGDIVTTAAVNMNVAHDKAQNLNKLMKYIDLAADQGAHLIVFPELALQGYLWTMNNPSSEEWDYHYNNSEEIPGETTRRLADKAKEKDILIVFGMTERARLSFSTVILNSAVLIGPDGIIGIHRKVHLPEDEIHIFHPGNCYPVFETDIGRIGMLICWDLWFPEASRELALQGVELIVAISAWPSSFGNTWDIFTRARAAENCCWVIGSNQVGRCDKGEFIYFGHSRIVDPDGNLEADAGENEKLELAGIPVKEKLARKQREVLYTLRWRQPRTYIKIADEHIYQF